MIPFYLCSFHSTAAIRQPSTPRPLHRLGRTCSVTWPLGLRESWHRRVKQEEEREEGEEEEEEEEEEAVPCHPP